MKRALLMFTTMYGCGPASLSGEVDGERVGGARDALYDTYSLDLGPFGDYAFAFVFVTDFADACEVVASYSDAFAFGCEERCEEILEVSERHGLDDESYWSFAMTVNISDGEVGEFDYETDLAGIEENEFSGSFSSWAGGPLQDPSLCESACEDGALFESDDEVGEGGQLEITNFDGEILSGRFEVDLGDDEGLSGSFDAHPCDTEDWIF
jgi:hypothetical protein